MWNQFFFSKFRGLLFVFLFFYYFLHFLFNFVCVFVKKILEIFIFFILWIKDFNKDFWKIMEHFSKKYGHLKSKVFHKFHYLLFVFLFIYYFSIFDVFFFSISPNQTCQTIINIFVELYYTDYRFYQRILENSWILIKKNRDIENTKHFQNSVVTISFLSF